MATALSIQSNFTAGELDPLLHARVDFASYYKGAQKIRNLLTVPQGGLQRRFGLEFIQNITPFSVSSFDEVALHTFEHSDGSEYLLMFVSDFIRIYFEDVLVANLASPYGIADIPNINITQSIDRSIIVNGTIAPRELIRTAAHGGWILGAPTFKFFPSYDFRQNYDSATFTPSATTGNITLTASLPVFVPEHVGGLYRGNGGTVRITGFSSTTLVSGFTVTDFIDGAAVLGTLSFLGEVAFSDGRGWPKTVTFFQNRLTFGGTLTLPNGVFLSAVNDYFNFNDSVTNDADAISVFIHGRRGNTIIHIVGYTSLMIFTDHGEFSSSLVQENPLTPSNAFFTEQTSHGIAPPEISFVDNQIIVIDQGGKIIRSLTYNSGRVKYDEVDISVFSPQLIDTPIDVSSYENTDRDNGTYLFFANEDGTLAVYQTLKEQAVSAWTLCTTAGSFGKTANLRNQVYFIVNRNIDGQDVFYLEKLDFDRFTDSAVFETFGIPTDVVTGLDHLEGQEVNVIGDDLIFNNNTVVGGQITLEKEVSTVEVGINFQPLLIPMPLNVQTPFGNNIYLPKRIKTTFIDYFESLGIRVNGVLIPSLEFGTGTSFNPIAPKTDFSKIPLLNGWNPRDTIEITQVEPLPMTIRGIGYEVDM